MDFSGTSMLGVSDLSMSRFGSSYGLNRYNRYPNPFFDLSGTYLPKSIKEAFVWCEYYYLTNPIIHAAVTKMAQYPISELAVDSGEEQKKQVLKLCKKIQLRKYLVEFGLDYYGYGSAFATVSFPFKKHLICSKCQTAHYIKGHDTKYEWKNREYYLTCRKCGFKGRANVEDVYIRAADQIRLIRWSPKNITILANPFGGETSITYTPTPALRTHVLTGRRLFIETLPTEMVNAICLNKPFLLTKVYQMKRPAISSESLEGWGCPMIMPALKDAHLRQIMFKGQEAISLDHIVPLRMLSPRMTSPNADPAQMMELDKWAGQIEKELAKWRQDPNYIPIMPFPSEVTGVGGQGRAMMLHQEMRMHAEDMLAGMCVPLEFIYGGMQWSGSNQSIQLLKQQLETYRTDVDEMLEFFFTEIATYMNWPQVKVTLARMKMGDDSQRTMVLSQMNQAGKCSDQTLQIEAGLDPIEEKERLELERADRLTSTRAEQVAMAATGGEAKLVDSRYTAKAQEVLGQYGMLNQQGQTNTAGPSLSGDLMAAITQSPISSGSPGGVSVIQQATTLARNFLKLKESGKYTEANQLLTTIRSKTPNLFGIVLARIQQQESHGHDAEEILSRPMPEIKPPRSPARQVGPEIA